VYRSLVSRRKGTSKSPMIIITIVFSFLFEFPLLFFFLPSDDLLTGTLRLRIGREIGSKVRSRIAGQKQSHIIRKCSLAKKCNKRPRAADVPYTVHIYFIFFLQKVVNH